MFGFVGPVGAPARLAHGRALSAHPRASLGLAILQGLSGDALETERNDLVEPMSVRGWTAEWSRHGVTH